MRRNLRRIKSLLLIVFTLGCLSSAAYAIPAYGVTTTNQLVRFDTTTPNNATVIGSITGLQVAEDILGIDFRPANGQLYALGSSSRLYTINLITGAATPVGAAGAFSLSGGSYGFDFNPTVDRIRVVSNAGQNLRLNPNDGTLTAVDTNLNPGSPAVTAAAYTNNVQGATTTTLYVIDTNSNTLFIQNPPNNGTLVSVGGLGVATTSNNGFDIAADGTAYAAIAVSGTTRLYTVNLTTGAATLVGVIGDGTMTLRAFAVALPNTPGFNNRIKTVLDYDGDLRTDAAVFRTTTSTFFIRRSSNGSAIVQPFGIAGTDIQVPGDYDGDNLTDIAVFRTTNGFFYILQSSTGTIRSEQFGLGTDEPVARDYDGDGRTDLAVVRRQNGQLFWFIRNSINGSFRAEQFGRDTDVVAPGDYDGDRRFDLAVFRAEANGQGTFYIRQSSGGDRAQQFGLGSDLVVPGDYDGDGRYDFALARQGTQINWLILQSSNNTARVVQFGAKSHFTAQGDYDGDGRTDIATFDPTSGNFFVLQSSNNAFTVIRWGNNQDYPVANYDTH
ncbi:MAG: DUF4394 domain-containing protein [Acidobacteriota bacterium]|nr:DUF4394 domain-containing protein [Acidobacteriota bacterium]